MFNLNKKDLPSLGLFLIAFTIIPLLFTRTVIDPWNLPRLPAWSLFICIAALVSTFRKADTLKTSKTFMLLCAAWLGWTALSLVHLQNTGEALYISGLRLLTICFILWLCCQKNIRLLVPALCLFALAEVLIASGEFAGLIHMKTFTPVPAGTTGNNNLYGCLMALLAPFPLMLLQKGNRLRNTLITLLVFAVLVCIALSGSKAAVLATTLAGGTTLLLLLTGRKKEGSKSKAKKGLALVFTAPLLLLMAAPVAWSFLTPSLDVTKGIGEHISGVEERAVLWSETRQMATENPLLGCGPAGWKYRILERGLTAYTDDYAVRYFPAPHNDFLWVLAESGFPALIAYSALLLLLYFLAIRRGLQATDKKEQWQSFLLAGGILIWVVVSGFNFPLERVDHLIVFAAYAALILSQGVQVKPLPSRLKMVIMPMVALSAGGMFYVGGLRFAGERELAKAIVAEKTGKWDQGEKASTKAENRFYTADYASSTPLAWHRGIGFFQMGKYGKALAEFREAEQVNPWHPHVLNNLGSAFAATGQTDSAVVWYSKTIGIFPRFPDPYINLSRIYAAAGDTVRALKTLGDFPPGKTKSNQLIDQQRRFLEQKGQ